MSSRTQNRIVEEIRRDLFSEDDALVMKALYKCREQGDASLVEPLILVFAGTKSEEIRGEVADMLETLKVGNTEEIFHRALLNPALLSIRKNILSFMWNSGVQPTEFIGLISTIATEGSLQETLECLTLLDSLDGGLSEEQLLDSIATVREYLGENKQNEKTALLTEYLTILQAMNED